MNTHAGAAVQARLVRLGYALPAPLSAKGRYVRARRWQGTLWVSGHTGRGPEGLRVTGTVGDDVTIEQAQEEARRAAVNLLAAVDGAIGLAEVKALLHLRGFVRAVPGFGDHTVVVDAASALLCEALGEIGEHARTAIGVASLPGGAAVELEAVFACAH